MWSASTSASTRQTTPSPMSRGKDLEVLKASIGRIHAFAAELIAGIEGPEKELQKAPSHRQRKAGRTARRRRQDAPAR